MRAEHAVVNTPKPWRNDPPEGEGTCSWADRKGGPERNVAERAWHRPTEGLREGTTFRRACSGDGITPTAEGTARGCPRTRTAVADSQGTQTCCRGTVARDRAARGASCSARP